MKTSTTYKTITEASGRADGIANFIINEISSTDADHFDSDEIVAEYEIEVKVTEVVKSAMK